MANLHQGTDGYSVRIQDCRVWAEIYYLDSPTDYSEYLPAAGSHRKETGVGDELLMLADSEQSSWAGGTLLRWFVAGGLLILVTVCLRSLVQAVF